MLAQTPSSTCQVGAAQPFLNSSNLETLNPSQPPPTMRIMPESGHSSRHLATSAASLATAKDPKLRSDLRDVVLTLGGPGTGPV